MICLVFVCVSIRYFSSCYCCCYCCCICALSKCQLVHSTVTLVVTHTQSCCHKADCLSMDVPQHTQTYTYINTHTHTKYKHSNAYEYISNFWHLLDGQEDDAVVFIELLPSPQVVAVVAVVVVCHQISVYKYLEVFLLLLLLRLRLLVLTERQTKSKPKQDLCAYVNFSNAPQQTAKTPINRTQFRAQTQSQTEPEMVLEPQSKLELKLANWHSTRKCVGNIEQTHLARGRRMGRHKKYLYR